MTTYYVNPAASSNGSGSSWDDPFDNIQDAIDASSNSDMVWIKQGYVTLSAQLDVDKGIYIYGGFQSSLTGTNGSIGGRAAGAYTYINGASTYRGADVTVDDVWLSRLSFIYCAGVDGAGVAIHGSPGSPIDSITITECNFISCVASGNGGGLHVQDATNVVISNNCLFSSNTASSLGGGACFENEYTVGINSYCRFLNNTAGSGGGIMFYGTDADDDADIEDVYFHNNTAGSTGGNVYIYDNAGSDIKILRSLIAAGNASTCGGVYLYSGVLVVESCTIADNEDTGIELGGGGGSITGANNIVWGNDTQISGSVTITYSDVQGGYSGTGNVNDDPLFVGGSEVLLKYDLGGISDAIDSANAGAPNFRSTDIRDRDLYDHPDVTDSGAGSPTYADMGAYEYQGTAPNTCPMSSYRFSSLWPDDYTYRMYAVIRLPEQPPNFVSPHNINLSTGDVMPMARHRVSSELEMDATAATLDEAVTIDGYLSAHRYIPGTVAYTSPTRAIDYDDETKSSDDDHVAEDLRYPNGETHSYPGLERFQKYAIIEMEWDPSASSDVLSVFNVDIEQIFDYDYSFESFSTEAHPTTALIVPDMPVSSYHVKNVCQDSILRILYECRNAFSIPVFGLYAPVPPV